MNQQQARALLELLADLYILAQIPEPPPVPNGKVETFEPVKAKQ